MNAVWGKRTETLSRAAGTKTCRRRSAGAYTKAVSARLSVEDSPPAMSGRDGQNKWTGALLTTSIVIEPIPVR